MISTLTKLFSRKIELFNGLYAEKWLTRNLKNSHPVLNLDFSIINTKDYKIFEKSLQRKIASLAEDFSINLPNENLEDSSYFSFT